MHASMMKHSPYYKANYERWGITVPEGVAQNLLEQHGADEETAYQELGDKLCHLPELLSWLGY